MSSWETDANGNVVYASLTGFHGAPAAETLCMARIEFRRMSEQGAGKPEHLQIAMTPVQARQIASDLIQIAEKIEGRSSGQPQH
jgi:hypothetical protein